MIKKRTALSLGLYPNTSLMQARKIREEHRKLLNQSIDPQEFKKKI